MDMTRTEPQATLTGDRRDDARAEELNNLRLALATFALQLDAFELKMRASGAALWANTRPGMPAPPPGTGCRLQGGKMIGRQ
jgi:hypothetical protein